MRQYLIRFKYARDIFDTREYINSRYVQVTFDAKSKQLIPNKEVINWGAPVT